MVQTAHRSIALIGPSGAGKSTIGKLLAERLGWSFLDLDALIEQRAEMSISEIFEKEGEAGFRERESVLLVECLERGPLVLACGGGIVVRMFNRLQLAERSWCVYLTGSIEVLAERLAHDSSNPRPLLGQVALQRLAVMLGERRTLYGGLAQWTVHTDHLDPVQVVDEIMRGWGHSTDVPASMVAVDGGTYHVLIEPLEALADILTAHAIKGPCWVISDSQVGPLYGEVIVNTLRRAGFGAALSIVPAGESSKSLSQAESLYTWLLEQGIQRRDVVIALGGGVVGDLAGFIAATTLRGVDIVQVPTTILAMIDSSIGGKTGINHPRGKNLIGAFHQPRAVVCDPRVLSTLPVREMAAGWAEAVKHGVIADAALFDLLEQRGASLFDVPADTGSIIQQAAAVKIGIVNRDEREHHERMLLNYGHTMGQAIEAATGYTRYLHGEAVAIGMMFAAELAVRRGSFSREAFERQEALLKVLRLPIRPPADLDIEATLSSLLVDKKRAAGTVRWILPHQIGAAEACSDVSLTDVEGLLREWVGDGAKESA